jgi:hypothetical protein
MNKNIIFKWCDMKILLLFLFLLDNYIVSEIEFIKVLNKKNKYLGYLLFIPKSKLSINSENLFLTVTSVTWLIFAILR